MDAEYNGGRSEEKKVFCLYTRLMNDEIVDGVDESKCLVCVLSVFRKVFGSFECEIKTFFFSSIRPFVVAA